MVGQIKSSDVEERTVRGRGGKRMEKKFYEGLTGGLGRLCIPEKVYPDPWADVQRQRGPTMVHTGALRSREKRFWRRTETSLGSLSLSLSIHLCPSFSRARRS